MSDPANPDEVNDDHEAPKEESETATETGDEAQERTATEGDYNPTGEPPTESGEATQTPPAGDEDAATTGQGEDAAAPEDAAGGEDDTASAASPSPGDARAIGQRIRELADASEAEAEAATDDELPPDAVGIPCPVCTHAPGPVGFVPIELLPSPDSVTCDGCGGWGKVLTGSLQEENVIGPCPRCNGSGHRPRVEFEPPPVPVSSEVAAAQNDEVLRPAVIPQLPDFVPATPPR